MAMIEALFLVTSSSSQVKKKLKIEKTSLIANPESCNYKSWGGGGLTMLVHLRFMKVLCWYQQPRYKYLLIGGNSFIWKYTGQTLEPDDLNTDTPSVLNFKERFSS